MSVDAIFDASSYAFNLRSLPFACATVIVLAVTLYVLFTAGAPILRGALLIVAVGLLPFPTGLAVIGSTTDPHVAEALSKLAICLIPLSSAGAMIFLLALAGRLSQHKWLVVFAFVTSVATVPITVFTSLVIDGVWRTPIDLYYFTVPVNGIAQLQVAQIGVWVGIGIVVVARRIREEPNSARRRQLRGSVIAFSLCAAGLIDVPLGYRIGWFPVSWLALTLGLSLALRLLVVDDLIRARALDRRVLWGLVYTGLLIGGLWLGLRSVGDAPLWARISAVAAVFVILRVGVSLIRTIDRPRGRATRTTLERALDRYIHRVQSLRDQQQIGEATVELLELGIGCERIEFLTPSQSDYSWERLDGETLPEEQTPDPLLLVWLQQHERPILRDDLPTMRLGDLRTPLERLYERHDVEVLVPLVNRDEVVGLIALGAPDEGRGYRQEELHFLERLQEHAAAALVYARMHREATERVEVDKEVGLAAAVQRAFVPGSEVIERGGVVVAGIYEPASRCGGDWWSIHELEHGRVLVLIGDVTGHGVAAAMVTAAAKGCYDVAQRLMREEVDLVRLLGLLDATVRHAGGSQFYMTCFATLLDPAAGKVHFANAGHVVPYVCRPSDSGMDLDVLAARGDPLGAGDAKSYVQHEAELRDGDLLVWYTDGLVECANPRRQQFGDRRMQRMLRRLDRAVTDVAAVRDHVVRAAVAFQEGHPADDDITLVVGRISGTVTS